MTVADPVRPPRRESVTRAGRLAATAFVAALAMLLLPLGGAVQASVPEPVRGGSEFRNGPNTEIELTSTGPGQSVNGARPTDPAAPLPDDPYPASPPTDGYTTVNTFAGVINTATVTQPVVTAQMYCINLLVQTQAGIGYENGTWEQSNVPNIGYVTYILNNYYPTVPDAPASAATLNARAAAVQAAIWYFTDGFVLNANSPVRAATAEIIAAAQEGGALPEPPAPAVTITPAAESAPAGSVAGPFTVTTDAASVTLTVPAGYTMYGDETGTTPLANPLTTTSGTQVWVGSDDGDVDETVITARAAVTVQRGRVYLYDGLAPGIDDAQRLILADTAELDATAQATAEFFAVAPLTVDKTFAGDAVGEQGAIQLVVDCGDDVSRVADIPAGASTTQTRTFEGIAVGATCVITEPTTGETTAVEVVADVPPPVVIPEAGATATVTNTVSFRPGSLNVSKVIAGPQAGEQGEITLDVDCGDALQAVVVIPAGATGGTYTETYDDLPAGTECTITETATGETTTVAVVSDGPAVATIEPGVTVDAAVTDTVTFRPGSLILTKVITGAQAGEQGQITLAVDCGDALQDTLVIPAGAVADSYSSTYDDLPAGTECTVTETETGASTTVDVVSDGSTVAVIEPAAAVELTITDTVTFRPGSLNLTKVITGAQAGQQGEIALLVDCGDVLQEEILIPARAEAGSYSETYDDLPAGTECTVTETATGETPSVRVFSGGSVTVTVEPGAAADATLTNTVVQRTVLNALLPATGADMPLTVLWVSGAALAAGLLLVLASLLRRKLAAR